MASLYDSASLVMIPSGVKEDKLYSIKPTDGSGDFTFSRGSDIEATRVNSSGLIEKAKVNNLLQSNSFNTTWSVGGTLNSGQADKDGGTSAWSFTSASPTSGLSQNITTSGVQTFSAYIKKNATHGVRIYLFGSLNAATFFDLNNGAVVLSTGGVVDASIEAYNSEWWRVSVTCNSTLSSIVIYCTDNSSTQVVGTITIQDAQINHGLIAQDYVETTTTALVEGLTADLPRLDYSGGASCPSLLLEPSRTNSLIHSEYFDGWDKITQGTGLAPTLTLQGEFPLADKGGLFYQLQCDLDGGTTSNDRSYIRLSGFSGTPFTAAKSVWIKNNSASEVTLFVGISFISDAVTLAPNADWERVTIEGGVLNSEFRIGIQGGASNSDTIDVSIYGAQLEAGSYATSYIPTYGTAAVRGADSCSKTGISSLIGQTEGTLFLEAEAQSGFRTFSICDGSTSNRITIAHNVPSSFTTIPVYGGVVGTQISTSYTSGNIKIAVAYGGGSYSMFVNGVKINSTSIGTFSSTLNKIEFAQGNGGNQFAGDVKQSVLFTTALTDAECIALTTI